LSYFVDGSFQILLGQAPQTPSLTGTGQQTILVSTMCKKPKKTKQNKNNKKKSQTVLREQRELLI
jgi:hypothetical protein